MNKLKYIAIILLLFPLNSLATNRYVSSSTGNDSNPGTKASPWASIVKLNTVTFNPGDSILFKSGDNFTIPEGVNTGGFLVRQSGTISSPIVIASYGTGALPIITLPPITGWAGSGVYTVNFPTQSCCSILFEDGIPLTKATTSACTDGNWYGGVSILYYKPTSATPSSHTVTVANINNSYIPAIDLSAQQYITVTGLQFNSLGIGVKTFGATSAGEVGLIVQNCVFDYCQSGIFFMPGTGNNTNSTFQNNTFYRCQIGVRMYTIAAIGGSSTVGTHTGCKILNNEMSQCGTTNGTTHWQSSVAGTDYEGIGVQNFMSGIISNNYVHDGYCIGISWYNLATRSSDNNTVQSNQITNNLKGGLILIGDGSYNYSYNNNLFANNLFVNSNGAPGNNDGTIAIYQGTATTTNSKFVNNTLSGNLNNIAFETSNAPYFSIENNIIYLPGANNFVSYSYSSKPATLTMDYNLYYSTTSWIFGSNKTLAQMRSLGMELHSLTANPLFVNTSINNYQLQATSPAINAGINVGLPYSGSAPDMGAFEFGTDDTNALNALLAAGNTTLPTGHAPYSVSGVLNVAHNFNLNGNVINFTGTSFELLTTNPNVTISGGTLQGSSDNTTSNQSAIQINTPGVTVTGMTIKRFGQYGITTANPSTSITNNNVSDIGYIAISDVTSTGANTGIVISGNTIDRSMQPSPSVPQPAIIVKNFALGTQTGTVVSGNIITMPVNPSVAAADIIQFTNSLNAKFHDNVCTGGSIGCSAVGGTNNFQCFNNTFTNQNNEAIECGDLLNSNFHNNNITSGKIGMLFDGGSLCTLDTLSNTTMSGLTGVPIQFFQPNVHGITVNSVTASTVTNAILVSQGAYGININNSSFTGNNTTYAIKFDNSPGQMNLNNSSFANFTPKLVVGTASSPIVLNNIVGNLLTPATSFLGAVAGTNVSLGSNIIFTNGVAPTLAYSPSTMSYTQFILISPISPTTTGTPTLFSVSPALPASLLFSTSTAQISGVPLIPQASTPYTITAHNTYGSGSTGITITISATGSSVIRVPGRVAIVVP